MSNAAVCYRSSIENWSPQICGKYYVGNTKMEGMELEQKAFKKRFGKIISECLINISPWGKIVVDFRSPWGKKK